MFVFSQCVSWGVCHFYGQTIRLAVWACKWSAKFSGSKFRPGIAYTNCVQISFIYRETAARTLNWYQRRLSRKETRPKKQKNLFRHSVAPGNFPLKFLEHSSGVLSNCIFVKTVNNLALHHGGFVPCQWQAAMGQYFIYRGYWTFFIALPCRCGLRVGYIELVGFNDQLRSRVKTYLSARSWPSTIGQVRIMYVM